MKPTTGIDHSRPGELVTTGDEAMVKIDTQTGEVTLHPDLVAYGTAESGWLRIEGWQGSLGYQRGGGTWSSLEGSICIGDVVCEAIERGQIPLRAD